MFWNSFSRDKSKIQFSLHPISGNTEYTAMSNCARNTVIWSQCEPRYKPTCSGPEAWPAVVTQCSPRPFFQFRRWCRWDWSQAFFGLSGLLSSPTFTWFQRHHFLYFGISFLSHTLEAKREMTFSVHGCNGSIHWL
jgi:hypothetical protein